MPPTTPTGCRRPPTTRPAPSACSGFLGDTGVAATFCWVGRAAVERPDLVRRAVAEGHEIAVHSWDHRAYNRLSDDEQRSDMTRTLETLTDIAGVAPIGHKTASWRDFPAGRASLAWRTPDALSGP